MIQVPKIGEQLSKEHLDFLSAVAKSCRGTIIKMLKQSQSGHPGGSLSTIDYLSTLYSFIISQTGEKVVVSNGHISPAVYSILAECGYIPKQEVIDTFRQVGSIFEGHVTRHVKGIEYGTGPLGIGVSVASSFALAEKMNNSDNMVFGVMGDGEAQEGQVYEMMQFANKYKLSNYVLFVDYNRVQLTDSLDKIMPINIGAHFLAAGWEVLEIDGHNYDQIWDAIGKSYNSDKPVLILGKTIMGKGVSFMEETGSNFQSTWHGNAPGPEEADKAIEELQLSNNEKQLSETLKDIIKWKPSETVFPPLLSKVEIDAGEPVLYEPEKLTDNRSAYGAALLDMAKRNKNVVACSADLSGSVKTAGVESEKPNQHIEVGICEQQMVSLAGGLSLSGFVPFASTFGAFMSSRAKDQARVNDINYTNVKMVSTHCGLSVGEDGPTHQAIDDMSSFLGMFNTMVIEPADPNQCDRIIRYAASHYGNFYIRMGRHKYPVVTKDDGTPFYGTDYVYEYGKTDVVRKGSDLTIVASGALVGEAVKAVDELKQEDPELSLEVIAASSIKKFDQTVFNSIEKTGKVITAEDHNGIAGLHSQLAKSLIKEGINPSVYESVSVKEYQLSGKAPDLYEKTGLSSNGIKKLCHQILQK
ncbi:transketolase [Candidatus Peregrinibacteria bacterium]|nr:transketolase [Candidatus Peregrinibacteria bacterium]